MAVNILNSLQNVKFKQENKDILNESLNINNLFEDGKWNWLQYGKYTCHENDLK